MADVFVSYARADKARVAPLVAALEDQGWSVWWDPEITPGQEFDSQISAALDAARAVVVVWTPASVESRWVRGEAREAADRGVLAPVSFGAPRLPIDVRAIHTTDLDDWKEDAAGPAFQELSRALHVLIGSGPAPAVRAGAKPAGLGPSICVLPFVNMSGDPEQEYFSDGVSEDVITDLSKVSALEVISRTTAFSFKGKPIEVRQVASQLGVTHVLEGSVRKAGSRVRVTAQLIEGATDKHVWAERYDRNISDIFLLQDEIAQAIVAALQLKLFPEEKRAIENRGTTSLEAYDLFLRGLALANRASPAESPRAEALFREALAIDPDFWRARAGLCRVLVYRLTFLPLQNARTLAALESSIGEALAQAPGLWMNHALNGVLLMAKRDWLGAEAALERARAMAPGRYLGLSSVFYGAVGRRAEDRMALEGARDVDPLAMTVTMDLQQALYIEGRLEQAEAEYQRTLGLEGNREPPEHVALMRAWDTGDLERTKAQFRRFLDSRVLATPVLDHVLDVIDQPDAALELIRGAFADPAYQDATRMIILAWFAGRYGDAELAVAAFRRAIIDLNGVNPRAIWFPFLREVRRTAAFKQLIRDLGLYDYWRASGHWGDFARPVGEDDFEMIA